MIERRIFKLGDHPAWDKLLRKHGDIEQVELEEWADGADVTVYYFGEEDPYPYEALRGVTREDLDEAWDAYDLSLKVAART